MKELFKTLNSLNVNDYVEKKKTGPTELTYLSWTYAVKALSEKVEDWSYEIEPYTYDEKLGYMVHTSITIEGHTKKMWLPVMDGANKAMKDHPYVYQVKNKNHQYATWNEEKQKYIDRYGNEQPEYLNKQVEPASMMDINKAQMRCLVKNMAMFGLGLYIYAGEDLPEATEEQKELPKVEQPKTKTNASKPKTKAEKVGNYNPEEDPGEAPDENVIKYLESQPDDFKNQAISYYGVSSISDMTKMQTQHAVRILQNAKE